MSSHVGVLSAGRLVAQGTIDAVRGAAAPRVVVETSHAPQAAAVLAALVGAGVPVRQYRVQRPTLEDLFVALTGEGFDVER